MNNNVTNETEPPAASSLRWFMVTARYVAPDEPSPATMHFALQAVSVGTAFDRAVADLADLPWIRILVIDTGTPGQPMFTGVDDVIIVERAPLRGQKADACSDGGDIGTSETDARQDEPGDSP